jgi:hypothetical protein
MDNKNGKNLAGTISGMILLALVVFWILQFAGVIPNAIPNTKDYQDYQDQRAP